MKKRDTEQDLVPQQSGNHWGKPNIAVSLHHVIICNTYVNRPARISPKQWLDFWERVIAAELH